MKIQLDRIPYEGSHFIEEDPVAPYELTYTDFKFKDPIYLDISAHIVSGNLVVSGKISTKVHMSCSLCLKPFTRTWADPSYHFDCEVLQPHDTIDLTENIREAIIVGLPVKPLCREDCKGLCPSCGTNWNSASCGCSKKKMDIRWADLNKLKLE